MKTFKERLEASEKRAQEKVRLAKVITMKQRYKMAGIKKIGYLDIESSGLVGDFDVMLSYAILVRDLETDKTEIRYDIVKKSDFDLAYRRKNADLIDKRIVDNLLRDISDLQCIIGHWFIGKHRHDMPFIRTRASLNGLDHKLPPYGAIRYGDTQKWGSTLYRLHNNGLDSIGDMFRVSVKKTRLEPKQWKNACIGVKEALEYVIDHNIKDVKLTHDIHVGMESLVPIPSTYY